MICDSCKATVRILNRSDERRICNVCFLRENRPELCLAKLWSSNSLYDIGKKAYLPATIPVKFFDGCGFKLFKHTIFLNREISPIYKEELVLRFFGNSRCSRIVDYEWPPGLTICNWYDCNYTYY